MIVESWIVGSVVNTLSDFQTHYVSRKFQWRCIRIVQKNVLLMKQ